VNTNRSSIPPRLVTRVGIILGIILNTAAASAGDAREIALSGTHLNHRISLEGTKTRTVYEAQDYESTCYREVPYTEYYTQCDYRMVRHCSRVGGRRSCTPVCREATRPVCNRGGCQNVPTRECAPSCTNTPDTQSCVDRREAYNCRSIPYIAYRTVAYSCIKTRTVAVGTELVEKLFADVTIRLSGDVRSLSGKDAIKVSIANGNDVSRADLLVEMESSTDTHFFAVKKTEEKNESGMQESQIVANIEIEAIPYASILSRKTSILEMSADRGAINLLTAGEPIDDSVVLEIIAKKDRVIGGMKKDLERTVPGSSLKVSNVGGNQKVVAELGSCLNQRPHEIEVTLTRDASKLFGAEILNTSAVEKAKKDLAAKAKKRLKMKDAACSAGDGQN
jgi:hypothetical protein